jgi:transposase InsO family protein
VRRGAPVRRYQYTAIDDATRVRALKIYRRHTQANGIDFINYVVDKFPFRIRTIRTDRGHEFQALFHWHVADLGMEHVYIKPRTPQLNGKVERSHRTDKDEFYQLLTYRDDVDLEKKLAVWERFYNFDRPHAAHGGKTPYEALREKLAWRKTSGLIPNITRSLRRVRGRYGSAKSLAHRITAAISRRSRRPFRVPR